MTKESGYGGERTLIAILGITGVIIGGLAAVGGFFLFGQAGSGAARMNSMVMMLVGVVGALGTLLAALLFRAFLDLVDHAGAIRKHLEASEADDEEPNS